MANVIKPKRSSTSSSAPTTSDLADGEIAVNTADQKIYMRAGGSIVTVADTAAAASGISNVVEDTTPQLGGNLDLNSNNITGTGNITTTGDFTLTDTTDDSAAGPEFEFYRNSPSPADGDYLGQIKFQGENDADQKVLYAKITGKINDASDTTEDGLIEYAVRKAGTNTIVARLTGTALKLINSTGLEVAGNITVTGTVDGRDVATDGTKLDGIESNATADQTADQILTAIKTVDGDGSGLDADTLDGVQGSSFLRSDANDTSTGTLTLNSGSNQIFLGSDGAIELTRAAGGAYIDFKNSTGEDYDARIQLSGTDLNLNGSKIWTAGNDGSGSGLDADLLDGAQGSLYARLASPTFTGTPAAPTASTGTNTTQLATTAFVKQEIDALKALLYAYEQ